MDLLVTGGAGFIGSRFVESVLNLRDIRSVRVLDALTYAGNVRNLDSVRDDIEFIRGDIRDPAAVAAAVRGRDAVVNFAAHSHVDRSIAGARDFVSTNTEGTQVLVDAAILADVPRYLQVSTDEVYGSLAEGSWTEDSPLAPRSPYAASKAAGDMLVQAAHHTHGLHTVITRGSNTFGPRQHIEKLIPLFTTHLLRGIPAPLYGDGMNVRDWMHVDDHVTGIMGALMYGDAGEVYHLGGGYEIPNRDIVRIILETLGKDWDQVRTVADRKGHDRRYSLDTTKSRELFGFTPWRSTPGHIAETVRWYVDNPAWWSALLESETV